METHRIGKTPRVRTTPVTRRSALGIASGGIVAASGLALSGRTAAGQATPAATPAVGSEPTGIDLGAPLIARHQIVVDAPLDVVWGLHIDVANWPTWNPDITDVTVERPIAPGASFRWSTAGLAIRSTVYALTDRVRILWGGTTSGIVGIHSWAFADTADGVLVRTEESWSGEPVEAELARAEAGLNASLVSWLGHLKTAAEAAS